MATICAGVQAQSSTIAPSTGTVPTTTRPARPATSTTTQPANGSPTYSEYGRQGSEMNQNNSQWYNKDNTGLQNQPTQGNGTYNQPGYSNPANNGTHNNTITNPSGIQQPANGSAQPSGTIYGVPNTPVNGGQTTNGVLTNPNSPTTTSPAPTSRP